MKDSFNNEIQVGDRILYVEPRPTNRNRQNQIGTIVSMGSPIIVVEYDLQHNQGQQPDYSNYIYLNEDKFIKIETHTEVDYRVGDKVLCYCDIDNNHPFVGTVTQEPNNELCKIADELGINHILTKSEILFLLERTQYKVGDEVIVQKIPNYKLIFREGYNQSIPARVDDTDTYRERTLWANWKSGKF